MIDFNKAKVELKKYLQNFDLSNGKIDLKIRHTYRVLEFSELIAKDLNLSKEDIELAKLIGLLHDIGRFEQAKIYNDFRDYLTVDHAKLGVEILFDRNLIRNFIDTEEFDSIIYKAIANHNRLNIETELTEKELLHCKIIRDADKVDNFKVKYEEDLLNLLYMAKDMNEVENGKITDKIFNDFLESKLIVNEDRVTPLDHWISYSAFIFDFNYPYCFKYAKENDYINKTIDRINYKNPETRKRIEILKNHANNYINQKINYGGSL